MISFARSPRIVARPRPSTVEADRQVLDAVHEVRTHLSVLACGFEVRKPPEELAHHHFDLSPSEVGAETEVGTPTAEGEMLVR